MEIAMKVHDQVGIIQDLQLPKDALTPQLFQSHACGPHCVDEERLNKISMGGHNPLSIPLLQGWQREVRQEREETSIMYTAPCGRSLSSMKELHRYLRLYNSKMSVDLFDFDCKVNVLSEFTLTLNSQSICYKDISRGKENVKIPLANYVDNIVPTCFTYSKERVSDKDEPLDFDEEFLCGCDCTDDCENKEKCACWQLTIQGSSLNPGGVPDPSIGYHYKRLQEKVFTGIYECNQRCKCSKTNCLNRVVQHPLQLQLQLFKTVNKGWGVCCKNDIPKGTFICTYAGRIFTELTAQDRGQAEGDAYQTNLDYIEVVERMKVDYESDVEDDPEDNEQTPQKLGNFQSIRKLFEPNERVYVLDANQVGNVGRYLNHSCSPNVFVQNVFVDTHDLRFPWVAFFANNYIRAGEELTWDYNYEIGSVPDKQILCNCGSSECRKRLL